ncbi:MAG: endolytic transglycosylase MltG [Anaerolineales bacterium]|nr:endolytic transglycosylase MltG [Anaerolineales bacterium]
MKRANFTSLLLLLALLACLVAGALGWLAWRAPAQAEQIFGAPAKTLSAYQRWLISWQLILREKSLLSPRDPAAKPQSFAVELGEPTYEITRRLEAEGLIQDADLFRLYLIYAGLDTSIQAGEYTLSARMSPVEIARALQDSTPSEVTFRILAGWRLEEIAAALPTSGLTFTPEAFLSYAVTPPLSLPMIHELPPGSSLEGFLFPDRYRLPRDTGIQEFIQILLQRFNSQVDAELREGFARQGLDLVQAVTLASIVQREAVDANEMSLIASVFLNRLAAGMRLDSDPTIQYALGFQSDQNTWWKNPLTLKDLQIESPYNTYLHPGLPPGPICNPGLEALRAVAFPAQSPYYYFRAACDGSGKHLFSETLEEHQQNACP